MINKKFDGIKKTFTVLLILCFILSVTTASASAAVNSKNKDGYSDGYRKGYEDGKRQGQKDRNQYGSREAPSLKFHLLPTIPNGPNITKTATIEGTKRIHRRL